MNPRQTELLEVVSTFNAKRAEFDKFLQSFPVCAVEEIEMEVVIPEESRAHLEIQKNVINNLIKSIDTLAKNGAKDSEKALTALQEALNSTFNLGIELDMMGAKSSDETFQKADG